MLAERSIRSARVAWGIGMRATSLVSARLMETWAHGLDVRAALGAPPVDTRSPGPRRLARDPRPPLRLHGRGPGGTGRRRCASSSTLPSGARWTYGPDDGTEPHHR